MFLILRHAKKFQSTPSVGRATPIKSETDSAITYISIHALRGEGDKSLCRPYSRQNISIHALRGEGDRNRVIPPAHRLYFNPRPPWGGRQANYGISDISTRNFNPRPPWGGRHLVAQCLNLVGLFQSTPSVGRATLRGLPSTPTAVFQSTPSVGRATLISPPFLSSYQHFNPRPPWGGRRQVVERTALELAFQSTPSVGRATAQKWTEVITMSFQSTPSVGRATRRCVYVRHFQLDFNPRPPWGGRLLSSLTNPAR